MFPPRSAKAAWTQRIAWATDRAKVADDNWVRAAAAAAANNGSGDGAGTTTSSSPPPPPTPIVHPGVNNTKYVLMPVDKQRVDATDARAPPAMSGSYINYDLAPHALKKIVADAEATRSAAAAKAEAEAEASSALELELEPEAKPAEAKPKPPTGAELPTPRALRGLREGDVELSFLGTGSSAPAKYRNVSGIFLDVPSRGCMFLDAGEGTFGQLNRLYGAAGADARLRRLKMIWISHVHADHHVGVPTLLAERRARMIASGIENPPPLVVVGPPALRRYLLAYEQVQPLCYHFVACHEVREDRWAAAAADADADAADARRFPSLGFYEERSLNLVRAACEEMGLARVVSAPVVHCAQSYAVSVEAKPREKELVVESENAPAEKAADVVPGWKLVYSGDTRPCESLTRLATDATVLVHEATFENDMDEDAIKKRHSTTRDAVRTGVEARAYRTILTHFSQRYPKIPVLDESVSERTAVAFDMMRVDFARDLPRLPSLVPAVQAVFLDPEEVFGGGGNNTAAANKKKKWGPPPRGGSKSPPGR